MQVRKMTTSMAQETWSLKLFHSKTNDLK